MSVKRSETTATPKARARIGLVKIDTTGMPSHLAVLTVKSGNSLSRIAERIGVPLKILMNANPELCTPERKGGNLIFAGDQLLVPADALSPSGEAKKIAWAPKQAAAAAAASQPSQAVSKQARSAAPKVSTPAEAQAVDESPAADGAQALAPEAQITPEERAAFLSGASQFAQVMRESGAGAGAKIIEDAVKRQDLALLARFNRGFKETLKDAQGDQVAAMKLSSLSLMAAFATEKLPLDATRFDADLSTHTPSVAAERKARELLGPGESAGFDKFWKKQQPSLKLLDNTVARLSGKSVEGTSGLVHAAVVKALKAQFPDSQLDLVGQLPHEKYFGLSSTGEVSFKIERRSPTVTLPFRLALGEEGKLQTVPTGPGNAQQPKVELGTDTEGLPTLNGRAAPGTTVVIELAGQKAEVVTDAKGSWALAFSPNMPFDAKPEITVTEKLTEMYALRSDNADALVALEKLSPQALEDKLKASPGVTLGGLLRKAYPEVKELVARVDADGVLSGKQTAVNMGITIKPGEEFTHREFNHKKANGTALYGPMYAQLALEDKGPQPWALEEIEANVGAAVGNEGPTANAAQRELYQGAIDKLTKLHARFGSKEALLVSSVPVMVDSPNGQSFPTTVLKVEGPKGPIFVDTAGKEYSSWDDYRSNNTLPPDSVMTLPKNGTVELDAQGLPVIETKNTPSTVDTWQENALYWGQWALMGVGMGTGVGMMATMGLRAYKMISVFRAAQAMGTMARAGQGFAGVSLLGAGYQGHDRYTHGQTFSVLDAEARQMYYGAAFGLTMPAMQTLIKGAKTVAGAYTAGTAMFAGQTSLLASTAEDAALFYENWDSPDLKMSDKAMFFANLGMLGGFMVTGGVKAQFSPSFLRHQAQASMRPTPALTAKMARVVEAMQRRKPVAAPDALTPTETRWLEAKVEGLIGMQETNEHRMLFRNIFDAPINTQQLGNFKALKGKLFDKGPLDATDVSILHSLTAFTPWRQQPMPENLQPGLTTLFTEAGAAAAKRPHQALDRSDRSWLGSKFKEIFKAAKPDSLPAERLTNLRSVEAKLAKNQPLTQAEVLTLVQVTTANGYADLSFVAEAAKPVAEPANKRAAKAKPTGKVAAKSKEKTKTK